MSTLGWWLVTDHVPIMPASQPHTRASSGSSRRTRSARRAEALDRERMAQAGTSAC